MSKPEATLCRETAQQQIDKFAATWGMYDAKAIISGGEESSIPEEMEETLLANIMTGNVDVSEDGKVVTHKLTEEAGGLKEIIYKRMSIRKHQLTEAQEKLEKDQALAIAQMVSEVDDLVISELSTRDLATTAALATYISFT